MEYQAKKIDQDSVTWATDIAIERQRTIIRKSINLVNDPEKKKRLETSMCKICFYQEGRIGGAAMTHQPCGICGKDQLYSSTATDVLCRECAKENHLCKQCGADVQLKPRRKYP